MTDDPPTDEPVSREGEREVGRLLIEALDFMDEPTLHDFVEQLARELTPDPSRMTENVGLVMGLDRFKQAVRKADSAAHADARSGEVCRRIRAACDCDPGEELAALERLIDYYDGMQAFIEIHFGNVVDEVVEDPQTDPARLSDAPSGERERDG